MRHIVTHISFLLLIQPLARMGATVTGVDAVDKNIKIARLHAVCLLECFQDAPLNCCFFFACLVNVQFKDLPIPEIS